METPLLVGLVAAGSAITSATITAAVNGRNWRLERQKLSRESEKLELEIAKLREETKKLAAETKKLGEVATTVAEELENRLGYKVRELYSDTSFDENGDGESRRKWIDLEVTKPINDLRIDIKFRTSGVSEDPYIVELVNSAHRVHFELKQRAGDLVEGWAVVNGNMVPDEKVSFVATHRFKRAFTTSYEAALEQYKNEEYKTEYAITDASMPAESLKRQVTFPPSHRDLSPTPHVVVFAGTGESVDTEEGIRVRSGLSFSGNTALLVVNAPKLGRRYGIGWTPPRAKPQTA